MSHDHKWDYQARGLGEPPKANLPERILFEGHTSKCAKCDKVYFFPDDPKLQPVEVESA